MERRLRDALETRTLRDPSPLAETAAARLWRVTGPAGEALVLKLYRKGHAGNEAAGSALLTAWQAMGAPALASRAEAPGLLLMPYHAGPRLGDLARSGRLRDADRALAGIARRLHAATLPSPPTFPDLAPWFGALFDLRCAPDCPATLRANITRAAHLAERLLSGSDRRPLHGDLHHDNVLGRPGDRLAIDAKGLLGDPAFELANAMRNPKGCGAAIRDPDTQTWRCQRFAEALDVEPVRLAQWAAAKAALSIAWSAGETLTDHPDADLLEGLLALAERGAATPGGSVPHRGCDQ